MGGCSLDATAVGVSIFNFPLFRLICRFEKHFSKILLAGFGSEHAVFAVLHCSAVIPSS